MTDESLSSTPDRPEADNSPDALRRFQYLGVPVLRPGAEGNYKATPGCRERCCFDPPGTPEGEDTPKWKATLAARQERRRVADGAPAGRIADGAAEVRRRGAAPAGGHTFQGPRGAVVRLHAVGRALFQPSHPSPHAGIVTTPDDGLAPQGWCMRPLEGARDAEREPRRWEGAKTDL